MKIYYPTGVCDVYAIEQPEWHAFCSASLAAAFAETIVPDGRDRRALEVDRDNGGDGGKNKNN